MQRERCAGTRVGTVRELLRSISTTSRHRRTFQSSAQLLSGRPCVPVDSEALSTLCFKRLEGLSSVRGDGVVPCMRLKSSLHIRLQACVAVLLVYYFRLHHPSTGCKMRLWRCCRGTSFLAGSVSTVSVLRSSLDFSEAALYIYTSLPPFNRVEAARSLRVLNSLRLSTGSSIRSVYHTTSTQRTGKPPPPALVPIPAVRGQSHDSQGPALALLSDLKDREIEPRIYSTIDH